MPLFDMDLFQKVSLVVEDEKSVRRLARKLQTTPNKSGLRSFNWTIVHYDQQKMGIQLSFESPGSLTKEVVDRLQLDYKKPEKFLIYAQTMATPQKEGFVQTKSVPKQLVHEISVSV